MFRVFSLSLSFLLFPSHTMERTRVAFSMSAQKIRDTPRECFLLSLFFPARITARCRVTLIKVVIMRNMETRCNHDCTRSFANAIDRARLFAGARMQRRRSSRLHGNLELAFAALSSGVWCTARLGTKEKPFPGWAGDGWPKDDDDGGGNCAATDAHRAIFRRGLFSTKRRKSSKERERGRLFHQRGQ